MQILIYHPAHLFAQVSLSGVVRDSITSEPIIGVSVSVRGTTTGAQTDAEGKFTVKGAAGSVLLFRYVGYRIQQVTVQNSQPIRVQLAPTSQSLKEVVLVSYGTQRRREVTGAVSQINTSEVKDMPVPNVGQRLQGKLAGVQINQNSGSPGSEMSFRIRGAASINAGNNPLIVIDGFPSVSGLQTLSPDEIETITVLKDASASSLYGSRAANGVILVTTKQAKNGQKSLELSSYTGFQSVPNRGKPDLMNGQE
ncbi:MAG: TonB-dependent receptor plug domain-containing protein, partial [Mucilaginibacter polytrichastri]|nr:TonB-dependent receptor plug domain-containing protein [Mucilaginibacter polytrichastri]